MSSKHKVDFIIVGQGLAGSCLTVQLLELGHEVMVIDDNNANAASRVAAGMYNPIVFKRLNKTWKADEFLPQALSFYRDLGERFGNELVHERRIVRIFPDQLAANDFESKSSASGFEDYLSLESVDELEGYPNPFGYGVVHSSGYVDLRKMLVNVRSWLEEKGAILNELFDEDRLVVNAGGVEYGGFTAENIVFCQGHHALESKYWNWVNLRRTKGEVLELSSDKMPFRDVVNNGRFLLPRSEGKFVIGSTYEWHTDDCSITEEARDLLLAKMEPYLSEDVEIKEQRAGIRPVCSDRRPALGQHPEHNRLWIFNGLGTRGVMIAPSLASHLIDVMKENAQVDPIVDVQRFHS